MHREPELWERIWLGRWSRIYLNAGKLIGHLGCGAFVFWDAAKLLPNYDKYRYENAVRELTVYEKRERGEYELHASAKKILRVILGPSPESPDYESWWRGRLISVEQAKREGHVVEWAECPPVPLPGDEPKVDEPKPAKKPRARKKSA